MISHGRLVPILLFPARQNQLAGQLHAYEDIGMTERVAKMLNYCRITTIQGISPARHYKPTACESVCLTYPLVNFSL